MKKPSLTKIRKWWKSSVTGRFVSRLFAKGNPETTFEQEHRDVRN